MIRYGAKSLPYGGWWAIPPVAGNGWMILGDSAGFLNSQRLKGIHLAIKSGMLAAETAFRGVEEGRLLGRDAERDFSRKSNPVGLKKNYGRCAIFIRASNTASGEGCSMPAFSSSPADAACAIAIRGRRATRG